MDTRTRRGAAVVVALAVLLPVVLARLDAAGRLPLALRGAAWPAGALAVLAVAVAAWVAARRPQPATRRTTIAWAVAAVLGAVLIGVVTQRAAAEYELPRASSDEVGRLLPEVTLLDDRGAAVPLRSLKEKATLLVWFRGTWCPYCRRQLANLGAALPEYGEHVRVVAVTSDPPEALATMRQELGLPYAVLSDPAGAVMGQCEFMHCVAILDRDGVVRFQGLAGSWRGALRIRPLLQAAYRAR